MFSENEEATQQLTNIAANACRELFAAYGVSVDDANGTPLQEKEILFCGVMGFVGRDVRGMCLLGASGSSVEESCPGQGDLRDWLGELTNQLVGRIKTKLLSRGIEIALTTPVVLKGEHIAPVPRRMLNPEVLFTKSGSVLLWVEIETTPEFSLKEDSPEALLAREGELLIF